MSHEPEKQLPVEKIEEKDSQDPLKDDAIESNDDKKAINELTHTLRGLNTRQLPTWFDQRTPANGETIRPSPRMDR